jgi:uncharacterized protein (DUF427 family)
MEAFLLSIAGPEQARCRMLRRLPALRGTRRGGSDMKAVLKDKVIADSDDIVERGGYRYFPASSVRMQWLEKAPKTAKDLECPHGVQFYARAAWSYEAPRPAMVATAGRIGFWQDVEVG